MMNRELGEKDRVFQIACEMAKVEPTKRQASKFLNQKGLAYPMRKLAVTKYKNELRNA